MRVVTRIPLVGLILALVGGCGPGDASEDAETAEPVVYTTFYPTTFFAERIAGGLVEVVCPIPEDEDPIFWQPSREAIQRYQEASLVVVNGAEFEKWVESASLPRSRVVDTAASFEDRLVTYQATTTHSHGAKGMHAHTGIDGHTWMDPALAAIQAEAIRDALCARFPEHASAFRRNSQALAAELGALDARLQAISLEDIAILCSHPAYNYLSRRCAWEVVNFDLDPDSPLTPEQLEAIRQAVEDTGFVPVMLWETEPLPETAQALQGELGVRSILFSPCELLGETERAAGFDYLKVMNANVDRLVALTQGLAFPFRR